MHCDLCGKETDEIYKAEIEGSVFNVCRDCASLGRIISKVSTKSHNKVAKSFKKQQRVEKEVIQVIVPDYAKIIRSAREKAGLKQEELAKKIAEKDSLIHAIESGKHEPPIAVARKLERALGIHLITEEEVSYKEPKKSNSKDQSDEITLGDIIKIRKR